MKIKEIKLATIAIILLILFLMMSSRCISQTHYSTNTIISQTISNNTEEISVADNVTLTIIGSFSNWTGSIILQGCNSKLDITGSFTGSYNNIDIIRICDDCIPMSNVTNSGSYDNGYLKALGGISYVGVSCSAPLPVELITLDCNSEIIKWTTGSEINNDFFIIQYSKDGSIWKHDGIVEGNGNSNEMINYEYDISKDGYYKVTQVDFDGRYQSFDILYCNGNRNPVKTLVTTYNLLGQEVNNNTRGLVIEVYSDNTKVKVYR